MLYWLLVYLCAAAIMCGVIWLGRVIISQFTHKQDWTPRPYYWTIAAVIFLVVLKSCEIFAHKDIEAQKQQIADDNYAVFYNTCIKHVGKQEAQIIKQVSGIDFCDCVASETIKHIGSDTDEKMLVDATVNATKLCENLIDKELDKQDL